MAKKPKNKRSKEEKSIQSVKIKLKYLRNAVKFADASFKEYPTLNTCICPLVVSIDGPWFYIKVTR